MTLVEEDIDPLALERQVCFALAVTNRGRVGRVPAAARAPQADPSAVPRNARAGDHHKSGADRPLSVKAIAGALQLDSATLSPMLKRLEALGLITRTRSVADERATDVELTQADIQLRRGALKIPPAVVERLGVGSTNSNGRAPGRFIESPSRRRARPRPAPRRSRE
jgi:hypothetical protein